MPQIFTQIPYSSTKFVV